MIHLASVKAIALGPFNPHIITPGWLRDTEVIADLPGEFDNFDAGGEPEDIAFSTADIDWQVDGRSLSVESEWLGRDCSEYLARVIRLLPHTPIRAVVNEFYFTASPLEWADGPLPHIGSRSPTALIDAGLEAVRWAGLFDRRDARAELTLESDLKRNGTIGASLRYFRRIRSSKAKDASAEAVLAAAQFLGDLADAKELILSVFGHTVMS